MEASSWGLGVSPKLAGLFSSVKQGEKELTSQAHCEYQVRYHAQNMWHQPAIEVFGIGI